MELVLKAKKVRGRLVFTDRSRAKLLRFVSHINQTDLLVTVSAPSAKNYKGFYYGLLLPELVRITGEVSGILDMQLRDCFGFGRDISNYNDEQWVQFTQSVIAFFEIDL